MNLQEAKQNLKEKAILFTGQGGKITGENFEDYLNGFSENVKEIIEKFKLKTHVAHMASKDVLLNVLEKFTSPYINLTPFERNDPEGRKLPPLSNLGMGYVFEELIRKFNEDNNEEAGEHFTPREVIDLMTHIIFEPIKDNLPPVMTIYDPACGSGGMLTESQNFVKDEEGKIRANGDVYLYGKEINDETYAICKSDMMIKGNNPENIRVGSTLSTDEFAGNNFDFMLSNPPYGKSWATEQKYIKDGKEIIDPRFQIRLENYWGIEEDADGTPNRGYRTRIKGGYFPVSPTDQFADLRDEMVMNLGKVGLLVERAHHEVGTAGQMEINYRFSDILTAGDELMKFKYIIKNTAWAAGKTATFMPKPLFGDNGSGMHVHQSLWKDGKPLFWGDGYANLSDMARWYIGGLLKHAPSLLAFTNPTVNSYKRLVPGYEAPVNLVYSARNRSACIRIPITGSNPKAKRIEFRCPDPSSNPYLAFAAMLMAGIDGIQNKIEPPKPVDKDLYELEGDEAKAIPQVPGSLDAVLDNLERDNEFLTRGGVFTKDLIDTWIDFKRKQEVDYVRMRPHPAEFELYYDL